MTDKADLIEQQIALWAECSGETAGQIKLLCENHFIEQACDAVDAKKKKTIPGRVSISMFDDAYNDGLDAAEQAIRDRFEGEK